MGNRPAKVRIPLYCLGVYLGFMVIFWSETPLTSSVTFSVLLIMMNGATAKTRTIYARKRLLGQAIGLACGWTFYMLLDFLPYSQKVSISMTLGAAAALSINAIWKLGINELLICTPVFLIALSVPSRGPAYPLWRLGYVAVGIGLGYLITLFVFPVNYRERYQAAARSLGGLLAAGGEIPGGVDLRRAMPLQAALEAELANLRDDRSPFRKYLKVDDNGLERYSAATKAGRLLLEALAQYESLSDELSEEFCEAFRSETGILRRDLANLLTDVDGYFLDVPVLTLPAETQAEWIAAAGVLNYCRHVKRAPAITRVEENGQPEEFQPLCAERE